MLKRVQLTKTQCQNGKKHTWEICEGYEENNTITCDKTGMSSRALSTETITLKVKSLQKEKFLNRD